MSHCIGYCIDVSTVHLPILLLFSCIGCVQRWKVPLPPNFATFFLGHGLRAGKFLTSQFCYFLTRSYSQSKNFQAPPDFANLFSCLGLNGGKLKKKPPNFATFLLGLVSEQECSTTSQFCYFLTRPYCQSRNIQAPPNFATFLLSLLFRAGLFKHLPILLLFYPAYTYISIQ